MKYDQLCACARAWQMFDKCKYLRRTPKAPGVASFCQPLYSQKKGDDAKYVARSVHSRSYITYIIYEHAINRKRQAKTKRQTNNTAVNAIKQATNTVDSNWSTVHESPCFTYPNCCKTLPCTLLASPENCSLTVALAWLSILFFLIPLAGLFCDRRRSIEPVLKCQIEGQFAIIRWQKSDFFFTGTGISWPDLIVGNVILSQ